MRNILYIICHCTAGPQTQKVSDIQAYWKNKLGWSRPGYHHLFEADGTEHHLLPIEKPSNGVAGFNQNSINISYIGGVKDGKAFDNRTKEQKAGMENRVRQYHGFFPNAKILGHRDFSPDKNRDGIIQPGEWMKSCPSFSVSEWIREIGLIPNAQPPVVKRMVQSKTGSAINIRKGPGIDYAVAGAAVKSGTAAIILSEQGGWTNVIVNDNLSGWIRNDFIK